MWTAHETSMGSLRGNEAAFRTRGLDLGIGLRFSVPPVLCQSDFDSIQVMITNLAPCDPYEMASRV